MSDDDVIGTLVIMLVFACVLLVTGWFYTTNDYDIAHSNLIIISNSSYRCELVNTLNEEKNNE